MKHIEKTESRWRRKVIGIPLVAWLIGVAGVALAVAGFVVILGTNGTLSAGNGINVVYNSHPSNSGTPINGTPTCDLVYQSPSLVTLTMSDALPNDTCRFRVETANTGASSARLNGFDLGSANFIATVNTGTGDLQCGGTLAAVSGVGFTDFDITASPSITPGTTYNLTPATEGLDWRVPTLYNAGECT